MSNNTTSMTFYDQRHSLASKIRAARSIIQDANTFVEREKRHNTFLDGMVTKSIAHVKKEIEALEETLSKEQILFVNKSVTLAVKEDLDQKASIVALAWEHYKDLVSLEKSIGTPTETKIERISGFREL
jgi:hypothetical protein